MLWKCLGKWLFYAYSSKRAPWCFTVVCQASICSCHILTKLPSRACHFPKKKKNMETIIESSFLPPSTADSNWRVEKDRLLLIKAVISSQPNIGWCCREKSTSIVISIRLKNVSRILFFPPPPIISIFNVFRKKVRSIHVSICFIIMHNEMVLKIGSNGYVRNTNFVFHSVIGQDKVKYSFR